jgi:hypothetical protein
MADYANIGDVLGVLLRLQDLKRREWDFASKVDGSTLAKDLVGAALDTDSNAQSTLGTRLRSFLESSEGPGLAAQHAGFLAAAGSGLTDFLAEEIAVSDDDRAAGLVNHLYDGVLAADGTIFISDYRGVMGALRKAMIDDAENIVENTITFPGGLTDFGNPTGALTLTTSTGEYYVLTGQLKIVCTSDVTEAVTFTVLHELDDRLIDGRLAVSGDNPLRLARSWQDGATGVTLRVDLDAPVITGDTSSVFSALTIINPTDATTDKGKIFPKVTRLTGDTWLVELYADASLTSITGSDASASGTVGTTALIISTSSGLVNVTIDKAALDGALLLGEAYGVDVAAGVQFDIVQPRIGDTYLLDTSNDEAGEFATKQAKVPTLRLALPSGVAASAGFTDTKAADITLP